MNKLFAALVGSLLILSASHAELETIVTTETTPSGLNTIIDVEYKEIDSHFTFDSFEQADKNGDGCLDQQEATDMGILNFSQYAKASSRCLNSEEYNKAMRGE